MKDEALPGGLSQYIKSPSMEILCTGSVKREREEGEGGGRGRREREREKGGIFSTHSVSWFNFVH